MKRVLPCLCVLFILPLVLFAEDFMAQGDTLFEKGRTGYESYKSSGDMYAKALEANPKSYDAAWKTARAFCVYAQESVKKGAPNYKAICKEYGEKGMGFAEKAIVLDPNKVEGNVWFALSVNSYAEGVSIVTALKEGLKGKTQGSLEKSYKINKAYMNGMPIKWLGRFWYVLPWPLQDKELSLKYFKEYQGMLSTNMDAEGMVFVAETLKATNGSKDEIKSLLQKASASDDKYYADKAKRLLADI